MGDIKEGKKSVSDIIIDRFLKDVDEKETMPWQRPYERYNAFNYFTKQAYKGINRLILPFGEYITRNQINEYNKKMGEDFKFQKGIEWFPVVYFTTQEKEVSHVEITEIFEGEDVSFEEGYIGTKGVWNYYYMGNKLLKRRNILRYYEVADRHHFKNSKGDLLPSRIETGEITITYEEPQLVIQDYIKRSGVKVSYDSGGVPCYIPLLDKVELNPYVRGEEEWFSIAFHELGHSTGHKSRLNRVGINKLKGSDKDNLYAVEECIAEITASLLCAECGIYSMETSESKSYENNLAYVKSWKKRVKDWGKEFIYIVSQADKAFNYIIGEESGKDR